MKTLIVTKDPKLAGGVSNFYLVYTRNYDHDDMEIEVFPQGLNKPQKWKQTFEYSFKHLMDLFRFFFKLLGNRDIRVVHLNPSYFHVPIVRDAGYILISRLFRREVIVLYHGWDVDFHEKIKVSSLLKPYRWIYKKASMTFVLANDFKDCLEEIGFKDISVTKTFFNGDDFPAVKNGGSQPPRLLYMGRMEIGKGVFDILDALRTVDREGFDFMIEYAGWFISDETEKRFNDTVKEYGLEDKVKFIGYIEGQNKVNKLCSTDVFIYPSYYSEGCPTVVIEAMAGGCPVISTDVAALKEVIKDDRNGYIVNAKDPDDIASKLTHVLSNFEEMMNKKESIQKEAFERYESRKIIGQFHEAYMDLARK